MRIAIAENVSNNPYWYPILDILLMFVEEGRHGFDASQSVELISSDWVLGRGADIADVIRLSALERSKDDLLDASLVIIDAECRRGGQAKSAQSTTIIHPLDAIVFLSTPFQVILENEVFDGAFLLWMAKALGFTKFIDAYRAGKFSFRHAGGKDSIERSAKTFLNGVWSRRDERYSRALPLWIGVVLDNDARHPGDSPNERIIEATTPHVSFVHQLKKRSIESYLPSSFLLKILKPRQVYALNRLSAEQKRHYHMKKGFRFERNDEPTLSDYRHSTKISAAEKELFLTIPQPDWQELRGGFGSGLSAIFLEEKYRPSANDTRFTEVEDRDELMGVLRKIYERI